MYYSMREASLPHFLAHIKKKQPGRVSCFCCGVDTTLLRVYVYTLALTLVTRIERNKTV
jgi:hypothetical protein